jgi:hypothetical protein
MEWDPPEILKRRKRMHKIGKEKLVRPQGGKSNSQTKLLDF